jgi:hypothetical protein
MRLGNLNFPLQSPIYSSHQFDDDSAMSDSEDNSIFGVSEDLVPNAAKHTTGISQVDFDGLLSPPLKLQVDLKNGCGGQLWPAGMVLSKYMLRKHRSDLNGKEM